MRYKNTDTLRIFHLPSPVEQDSNVMPSRGRKASMAGCRNIICLPPHFTRPSLELKGSMPFSLKLDVQDWQCIFHAFLQVAGRKTHAFPHLVGRHGFSFH